jgi:DNA-binding XRE family transcriptional regulator
MGQGCHKYANNLTLAVAVSVLLGINNEALYQFVFFHVKYREHITLAASIK